ncbi:dihydroneopterin aldolase, partial [bacterium]|nr:dihydroneopterin aldolase [bacterium]
MPTNSDTIRLNNAIFYAYHGALEEERALGQAFEVDVEVKGEFARNKGADDLHWTVDYTLLYRAVAEIFQSRSFQLLETMAATIAHGLLEKFQPIQEVTIR